jgi:hypothetical protein
MKTTQERLMVAAAIVLATSFGAGCASAPQVVVGHLSGGSSSSGGCAVSGPPVATEKVTSFRAVPAYSSEQAVAFDDRGNFVEAWVAEGDRPAVEWRASGSGPRDDDAMRVEALPQADRVLNPTVEPIDSKHFLVAWLEGSMEELHVRAITIESTGARRGEPLVFGGLEGSAIGVPRASFVGGGRGRVAFAESTSSGFQILAVPVECPL